MSRRSAKRTENWRAGFLGIGGSPSNTLHPFSRPLFVKTMGRVHTQTATTTGGNSAQIIVNNMNDPIHDGGNFIAVAANRHPTQHADLLVSRYTRALVRTCHVRFEITFTQTTAVKNSNFMFIWYFSANQDHPLLNTAALCANYCMNVRASPGVKYRHFTGSSNTNSKLPSSAVIKVNIPDVVALTKKLHVADLSGDAIAGNSLGSYTHTIADSNAATNMPALACNLNYQIVHTYGSLIATEEVTVDIIVSQNLTVYQDKTDAGNVVQPGLDND